jgi:DNA gyrase subunit A
MNTKNVIEQKITDTLRNNYMPYAMSVIVSRAIPEIDGFKPSHRKLLYTMFKMGLLTSHRTKSANVVGQTMKLNPHGDMAIYETLVRLTAGNNALLLPFIDSKGNFGKHYSKDMAFAAPRYTEVKLAKICEEIFKDIDKDTVDFIDNYDGTLTEPVLLPTTFPNILVNNNQGIAVGMANNICSFNLREVCNTTVAFLENENCDLLKTLKAPDFSSGGQLIYNKLDLKNLYETGRGSFKLRAKYRFDKKNNCIEIYEIPYTTTIEAIIDKIIDLIKSQKIKDISDVRDETDLNGLKITLDIKKSSDPEKVMNILFKFTPLQDTYSCNFNILINGNPKTLGVKQIISEWTNFRIQCIKRKIKYDINIKSNRLHLLKGLRKILLNIDKAIKIIRNTEEDSKVIPNLMEGFDIDKKQAEYIAEIKLRNLNKEYLLNQIKEIKNLDNDIKILGITVNNEDRIKEIIKLELHKISRKYGEERKTEIISENEVEEIDEEHLIEDYNLKLFLTKQNYIKKIPLTSLRGNWEQKLKEDDEFIQELDSNNKAELLLFSNKANVYKIKIYDLSTSKSSTLGDYLPSMFGLSNDEQILFLVATNDYKGSMLFGFDNGKMAKVTLNSYETKTNRKRLAKAYYDKPKIIYINFLEENINIELAAFSDNYKVLIFNTEEISEKTTRTTQGVQVMKLKKGCVMTNIKNLSQTEFSDDNYYRVKNIPAVGKFIKDEDIINKQTSFLD